MNIDHHESFRRMIDESLAGAISAEKEQSLREHLSTCAPCEEYLSASNRVIAGLSGFSFEVDPTFNARVLAALRLQMQQDRAARSHRRRFIRPYTVSLKIWAALAVALSCQSSERHFSTRWPSTLWSQCISTMLKSRKACSSSGCCRRSAQPYVCSRPLLRKEVLHDTAIGGAFGRVPGRARSCGCPLTNRNEGIFYPGLQWLSQHWRSRSGYSILLPARAVSYLLPKDFSARCRKRFGLA